jgi:hypothetical protein
MESRLISLDNCRNELEKGGVIQKERLYWSYEKHKQYVLLKDIQLQLSNGDVILIRKGFQWDLSSVPRLFWWALPPDGDFEISAVVHDALYQYHDNIDAITFIYRKDKNFDYSRYFADSEMFKWAKVSNGTRKISIKNIDNRLRYWGVLAFGAYAWDK